MLRIVYPRYKIFNFPSLKTENLSSIDFQLQQLYFTLPTNNEIVSKFMSKNYSNALTFILSKAEGITRSYNKAKNWSRFKLECAF